MKNLLYTFTILVICHPVIGQSPGDLDTTFSNDGVLTIEYRDGENIANSVGFYQNQIYVGGRMRTTSDISNFVIAGGVGKIDSTGKVDSLYGFLGATIPVARWWPHMVVNPFNGRSVLTGYENNAQWQHSVSGYDLVGNSDASFSDFSASLVPSAAERCRGNGVSPYNGDFISVGDINNSQELFAIKYLANGELDSTFGLSQNGSIRQFPNGFSGGRWTDAEFQADCKIVIGGRADGNNGAMGLWRVDAIGSPDTSFGTGGQATVQVPGATSHNVTGITIQPDGKILVAGHGSNTPTVARFNTDGSLDQSFGSNGLVTFSYAQNAWAEGVAVQPDGKIVVAVEEGNSNKIFWIIRINSDGSIDNSFGPSNNGRKSVSFPASSNAFPRDIAIHNKDIVAVGAATVGGTLSMAVTRVLSLDSSCGFVPSASFDTLINGLSVSFTDQSTNSPISRIWDFGDGSTDTSQNPSHAYQQSGIYDVTLISTNNCGSDTISKSLEIIVNGLTEALQFPGRIYPNPANENLIIEGLRSDQSQISIFNLIGEEFYPEVQRIGNSVNMNVSALGRGVYFLRILDGRKLYSSKVVIE